MRAEDEAADAGHGSFANVEFLLDVEGNKHEEGGEAAEDDIGQMRLVY